MRSGKYFAAFRLSTAVALLVGPLVGHADQLTVYSYLTPQFLQPVLTAFSHETGIAVDVEYMTANQLLERLETERDGPSADVVFTMEAKRLAEMVSAELLTPQTSAILQAKIPAQFRHPDNLWFGLSKWSRTVYYSTERVGPGEVSGYADLADAPIVPLQTSPLQGDGGAQPKQLIAAVAPLALEQNGRGVHMNISGFAQTRASRQPVLARRLMEYMTRPLAQRLYADAARDFPIIDGVRGRASQQIFGDFKEDSLPIAELANYYELAEDISKQEGWLWK